VLPTLPILYKLNEVSHGQQGEKLVEIHREMLCNPLKKFFSYATTEEIQGELLTRGLFDPFECTEISEILTRLEEKKVWEKLAHEFNYLKRLMNGPDVPICIYPLTKHRPIIEGIEVKKNGVSYNNILFLFLSIDLEIDEMKALLAHEYHHICRLSYINQSPYEIELLETLILEGMAECAIEELYGERWLSPWTKRYSQKECMKLWTKYFVQALPLQGVDNHFQFLYGNQAKGLPQWIGYCVGYRIVRSYLDNVGKLDQQQLYRTPVQEILKGSAFKI